MPLEQGNFAGYLNYEFNPSARFFAELNYVKSKLSSQIEPTPLGSDQVYGAFAFCEDGTCANGVPITSAIVPEALRAAVRTANPGVADENLVVGFRRRLTEVGNRGNEIDRDTFRVVTGFEGDLGESHAYELSINYGRTEDSQTSSGDIDANRFRQALDAAIPKGAIVREVFGGNALVAEGPLSPFFFPPNPQDAPFSAPSSSLSAPPSAAELLENAGWTLTASGTRAGRAGTSTDCIAGRTLLPGLSKLMFAALAGTMARARTRAAIVLIIQLPPERFGLTT